MVILCIHSFLLYIVGEFTVNQIIAFSQPFTVKFMVILQGVLKSNKVFSNIFQ